MTVSPVFSLLLRRTARWLAVLAALAALGFAVAATLMYVWVVPHIAEHRDTVANLMSRALGQRVTLESVSGAWKKTHPEFHLQGVRLYDQQGQPALYLPDLKALLAWRSLLVLEPRFRLIELQGLDLGMRRASDGHWYVGGIPINPAAPDSRFTNWLLRQGKVHASGVKLTWLDEIRHAPPLMLTDVEFTLTNILNTHRLQLHATPPATLARPLTIDAKLTAGNVEDSTTWRGIIETEVAGVSFPQLAVWLEVPYQPRQGWGALHVRFEVARGALASVAAGLDLRSIEASLGDALPPLRLAQVRGKAVWRREADTQYVTFENLQVARPGSALGKPFNAGLSWNATEHEITAQALTLGGWESVLPSLPMDPALRTRLQSLQPQGRFDDLRFRWSGAQPALDNFSVAARFTGLGVAAAGEQPGLANFNGRVEGDARSGMFEIDSKQMTMDLPALFREPVIAFDALHARGRWKKTARGRLLMLDEATFSNHDAAGSAKGQYELIAGQRGVIDLNLGLTRAEGSAVYRYLPKHVGDKTVNWVKESVVSGQSGDVKLVLKGDLSNFPFEQGNGVFRVEALVKNGIIDYVPGWPRIEGIEAHLLFLGRMMEVTSNQGQIYGVSLSPVKVVIPDLLHHDEQLLVEGVANGAIQDFFRFAKDSPVREHLRGITDPLVGSGPMRLTLKLQVPLRHSHDATIAGSLSFVGDTLRTANLPPLEQVRGDITFTESSLSAKNISAQFLGGPLSVDASTQTDRVQITTQGRVTAAGMAPWLGKAWASDLSGQTGWRGQIDLEPAGTRIRVESDLLGLGSRLPAPLAKGATQPLPLWVSSQPQGGGRQNEVRLGKTVAGVWRTAADGRFDRGEIRFGGPAVMPNEPGLRLAGSGRGLAFTSWLALLPEGKEEDSLPLSAIDLRFDAFDLMGRRYQDIHLQGSRRNGLFRTQVSGHEMSGQLTYRPAGTQPARVSAQFKQLTIPEVVPTAATEAATDTNMKAADFPTLDVTVEDFRLQDRAMGRLEAVAHGAPEGLVIDSLQLVHPDSVFRMSGLWRDGGQGETRAELHLKVVDAGKFLTRFGYADTLARGSAEVDGNATWEGSPADFSFSTLAGQLDFSAKGGQFLKVNPGAGKLLGVLSLQSLPRRLNFDFRDIFNQGYAFDDIHATLRIARGVVYSDDFKMRGPSAKVNMSGLADLNQETVQLRVKVIPKLSEGVAVAGALLGGPLAGVGALAAQKLLRDPIEQAISKEYMVVGPWQAPDVKRLSTSGKTDSQATEP
jgi:uncharacterized protein (TIGR02099 family)